MSVLAIDFGTSRTVAAVSLPDGRVRPLLFDGSPLLPLAVSPDIDAIGAVLAHVAREAHRVLGGRPDEVRLTHPVRQPVVLAEAALAAGFTDVRLVPKPVAAATYATAVLGLEVPVGRDLAVFTLGGESFDATVLRRTDHGFAVITDETLPAGPGSVVDSLTRLRNTVEVLLLGEAAHTRAVAPLVHMTLDVIPTVPEQPETVVAEGALYVHADPDPWWDLPSYSASPTGGGVGSPPGYATASPPRPDDTEQTQQMPAERHFVGEMPARVRVGREFSVVVEIRGRPADPGQHGHPLRIVAEPTGTPLWIIVRVGPGLEVLANSEDTMFVWPDRDSAPVRFALRARTPGTHAVRVSAWSGGTFLAELALHTSAADDRVDADPRRVSVAMGPARPPAGEATLLVEVEGGRYSFRWLTDGFLSSRALAEPLAGPPDAAVARTVETLRRIVTQESGYSPSNARRWVAETGVGLWQDMVPEPIKDQFWNLRDRMRALYIACSDDWMPWELLYPRAPRRDDGFLVQQLPVLRQVPDQHHSPVVGVRGAHCVVPPHSPSNARAEVDAVRRALLRAGVDGVSDRDIDSLDDLLDMLDSGSAGLLHFACHNGYSVESGGSSIRMAGGNFVPALLNSVRTDATLARMSPLVFLNACRSAGIAPYYTRMMGWAEQFMSAGAGAFVGTSWPVETGRAAAFAEAFYASLLAGGTLGEAGLRARRAIEDPADPSWLAYTIYGNPHAVAAFGK